MKASTLAVTLTTHFSLATATPLEKRFDVSATFHGANGESYSMLFPTDDSYVDITNPMVVYEISSNGGGFCDFIGEKGEDVHIFAEDRQKLKTPQVMDWGVCQNA